jgi:hypothetical protein
MILLTPELRERLLTNSGRRHFEKRNTAFQDCSFCALYL